MFSKEGEELHVKDILECKLEVEEEKETGSSATARAVKALLQGGLAASIRSLMAEETAKAVKKAILEERTRAANSGEMTDSDIYVKPLFARAQMTRNAVLRGYENCASSFKMAVLRHL